MGLRGERERWFWQRYWHAVFHNIYRERLGEGLPFTLSIGRGAVTGNPLHLCGSILVDWCLTYNKSEGLLNDKPVAFTVEKRNSGYCLRTGLNSQMSAGFSGYWEPENFLWHICMKKKWPALGVVEHTQRMPGTCLRTSKGKARMQMGSPRLREPHLSDQSEGILLEKASFNICQAQSGRCPPWCQSLETVTLPFPLLPPTTVTERGLKRTQTRQKRKNNAIWWRRDKDLHTFCSIFQTLIYSKQVREEVLTWKKDWSYHYYSGQSSGLLKWGCAMWTEETGESFLLLTINYKNRY